MGGPQPQNSRARSRWFLFGGVIILLVLGAGFLRAWYSQYQIQLEITRLQTETARLEAKRFELSKAITYAQSLNFAEEKARTELNLVKPGENVAVIGSGKVTPTRQTAGQQRGAMVQSTAPELTPFQKWWAYFFGSNTSTSTIN